MLSTYKKVRDVLESVRRYHEQLAAFYGDLIVKTDQEDVRMCLEYMKGQEENQARMMTEYLKTAPGKLCDTWMQYGPDQDLLTVLDEHSLEKGFTVGDLVDVWLQLNERLRSFYSDASLFVENEDLKDLFQRLTTQKEAEKANISKDATFLEWHM